MPSQTPRLRLIYHTLADKFQIQDFNDNSLALDEVPGIFLCTNATRPSDWTSFDDGRLIFETDTQELFFYDHADGESFKRIAGKGLLDTDSDTSISNNTNTYASAVEVEIEVLGGRPVQISVMAEGVANVDETPDFKILRTVDPNGTPDPSDLFEWAEDRGAFAFTIVDHSPTAGEINYSLEFKNGGDGAVSLDSVRITAVEL